MWFRRFLKIQICISKCTRVPRLTFLTILIVLLNTITEVNPVYPIISNFFQVTGTFFKYLSFIVPFFLIWQLLSSSSFNSLLKSYSFNRKRIFFIVIIQCLLSAVEFSLILGFSTYIICALQGDVSDLFMFDAQTLKLFIIWATLLSIYLMILGLIMNLLVMVFDQIIVSLSITIILSSSELLTLYLFRKAFFAGGLLSYENWELYPTGQFSSTLLLFILSITLITTVIYWVMMRSDWLTLNEDY